MHPCIRIICYLVGAVALAAGQFCTLIAVAVLLLLYALHGGHREAFAQSGFMLYRLRWLFLSLWVLYAGFTPGQALIPAWGDWSPTLEGIEQGLFRTAVLVCLIIGVQLLITGTRRDELLNAIVWLSRPLRVVGVHSERLALRMVLVMEAVPAVQSLLTEPAHRPAEAPTRLGRLSARAAQLFSDVLERAEHAPPQSMPLVTGLAPPVWQWLIPLVVALGLGWLPRICG